MRSAPSFHHRQPPRQASWLGIAARPAVRRRRRVPQDLPRRPDPPENLDLQLCQSGLRSGRAGHDRAAGDSAQTDELRSDRSSSRIPSTSPTVIRLVAARVSRPTTSTPGKGGRSTPTPTVGEMGCRARRLVYKYTDGSRSMAATPSRSNPTRPSRRCGSSTGLTSRRKKACPGSRRQARSAGASPATSRCIDIQRRMCWWRSRQANGLTTSHRRQGRSRGLEVDVSGRLTDSWSHDRQLCLYRRRVPKTRFEGNQLQNVAKNSGSLYLVYDFGTSLAGQLVRRRGALCG